MTIKKLVSSYSKKLKSSSPILDIELLLSKILNKPKEYLYTYPDKKLTTSQKINFKRLFNRRLKGEPIAYILEHQEFYKLDFKVNKNVLIPRPETEILVEEVIKYYKSQVSNLKPLISIVDIGVGSGAIIIALAKHFCHTEPVERIDKNTQIKFYGTDISVKALNIAKQNAKLNKVKIKFLKGNLLEPLIETQNSEFRIQNSIITANLPYLDKKEKNLLPSSDTRGLKFEPKIAWDGGEDGLKYYREFFKQIKNYNLKPQAIFLEIGHNQAAQIKKLVKHVLPAYKCKVIKDLCGFDRVVIIKS